MPLCSSIHKFHVAVLRGLTVPVFVWLPVIMTKIFPSFSSVSPYECRDHYEIGHGSLLQNTAFLPHSMVYKLCSSNSVTEYLINIKPVNQSVYIQAMTLPIKSLHICHSWLSSYHIQCNWKRIAVKLNKKWVNQPIWVIDFFHMKIPLQKFIPCKMVPSFIFLSLIILISCNQS